MIQESSAESILRAKLLQASKDRGNGLISKHTKQRTIRNSFFLTQKADIVGGGTITVLNALAGYLRYLEGTARDDWQEYVINFDCASTNLFLARVDQNQFMEIT